MFEICFGNMKLREDEIPGKDNTKENKIMQKARL